MGSVKGSEDHMDMQQEMTLVALGLLCDKVARLYTALGPVEKRGSTLSEQVENLWRKLALSRIFRNIR